MALKGFNFSMYFFLENGLRYKSTNCLRGKNIFRLMNYIDSSTKISF